MRVLFNIRILFFLIYYRLTLFRRLLFINEFTLKCLWLELHISLSWTWHSLAAGWSILGLLLLFGFLCLVLLFMLCINGRFLLNIIMLLLLLDKIIVKWFLYWALYGEWLSWGDCFSLILCVLMLILLFDFLNWS